MDWQQKKTTGEILTNKVRYALLFIQQGKCYICGINEWETKRRFDAHRINPGKNDGKYLFENTVLVCRKCHLLIEGMDLERINELRRTRRA